MGAYFWAFGNVSDSVLLNNCDRKEKGENERKRGGKKEQTRILDVIKNLLKKKGKKYKKYMIFGLRVRGYVLNYKKYMIMS